MQITFLGTGDAFCSGGRNQTCFHIILPRYQIMLDFGVTSLQAMRNHGIDTDSIDAIIISHFHGDHYGGLPYFLLDAHFMRNRSRPLHIVGPPGIQSRVEALTDAAYPGTIMGAFSYPIEYHSYQNRPINLDPLRIEAFEVIHAPESIPHGLRIKYEDYLLAYSGDTGWTENLYVIANDADLFICECNFFRIELPSHLNYQLLERKYSDFNARKIILNHLGPEMLENLDQCKIPCAHDGLVVDL